MKTFSLLAVSGVVLSILFGTSAFAQSIPEINAEMTAFTQRISALETAYLKPANFSKKYKLEARFNDASVAYEMKDYERASWLFIDVVSNERFRNFPYFRRAHYLLGDSLIKMRNYVGAKFYLEKLVSLGKGDYSSEAGALLLEVAYRTGNYESIDKIYADMRTGKMSPALYYLSGKAFYEKKNYSKARENFSNAANDKTYEKVATYFVGVSYAREKKFAEAKLQFEKVVASNPSNERDIEVTDLAYIALGRVAYEVGDIEYAIDHYNHVVRGSKHFDQALWELTWVLVSKKEYRTARTNVDILLLFENPRASLLAEAQLLRGDLSLRLEEYEQARTDYEMVIQKFSPISNAMNGFVAKHENVDDFFITLVQNDLNSIEANALPPLVDEWMRNDPKMKESMQTLHDVKKIEEDIAYSFLLLDEMDARLGSKNKVMSVPELADGLTRGVDIENRIMVLQRKLVDREVEIVGANISGANATKWASILGALDSLESRFLKIPQTRADLTQRDMQRLKAFSTTRHDLNDVEFEIKNQKAQILALNNYSLQAKKTTTQEKEELVSYRKKLVEEMAQTQNKKTQLTASLAKAKDDLGAGDTAIKAENALRAEYHSKLQEAQVFLAQFGSSEELTSIQATQGIIPSHKQRLQSFYTKLDALADGALAEIKKEVQKQRTLETSYRDSVKGLMSSSKGGAGILAYVNFMAARRQFNETVLKGDVGIIDVVWQRKDDRSTKIGQMFENRATELKLLQESFDEVR